MKDFKIYYGLEFNPFEKGQPDIPVETSDYREAMGRLVNVNIKFTKSVSLIFTSSGCYDHHPQSWISYPLFDMTFL